MAFMENGLAVPLGYKILFLALCIIFSGFFSMAEMALIKARKGRLQKLAEHGSKGAARAIYLIENPGKLLATVQVGITVFSTFAGAIGASQFAEPLSSILTKFGFDPKYSIPFSFIFLVFLISYLTLVFGELAPKRLALFNPERIAVFVSFGMKLVSVVATPLVALLSASSDIVLKLAPFKRSHGPKITEEEISEALDIGMESGLIEKFEHRLVNQVFRLGDLPVTSLMTPRLKIEGISLNSSDANLKKFFTIARHVSYPVFDGSMDNIVGIIHTQEALKYFLRDGEINMKHWLKEPLIIPEGETALNALRLFQRKKVHVGLVVDEYGGLKGIVTLRDFLRSILGEVKADAAHETPFRRRADGSWVVSGSVPIEAIQEKIGIDIREDKKAYFKTLAGFILHLLGKIPKEGDSFIYKNFRFEVIDMDGKRIDKILIDPQRKKVKPGVKG
jgi:putative hemolysin